MKYAFLFPGQGSQYVGMSKNLCENFAIAKQTFEEASESLKLDLKKLCFDGPESDLKLTQNTQPAILTASIAAYRVLCSEHPLKPALVAGHSLGEYSALVAAGALPFAPTVKVVSLRGQFMQEAVPAGTGGMVALVGATEESALALCKEASQKTGKIAEPANYNGGGQIVISGHQAAMEAAVKIAVENKDYAIARAIPLAVSAPFHCSLMKPAAEKLQSHIEALALGALSAPYIANVDAELVHDNKSIKERLLQQIDHSVRWEQSMQKLAGLEITEALEIGPGKVLSGLMRRIDRNIKCRGLDSAEDLKALS